VSRVVVRRLGVVRCRALHLTRRHLRLAPTSPWTRELCVTSAKRSEQRRNLESRAKDARCIRTLTFILSLTGRGDRISTSLRKGLLDNERLGCAVVLAGGVDYRDKKLDGVQRSRGGCVGGLDFGCAFD
jgi:hypothetical protein